MFYSMKASYSYLFRIVLAVLHSFLQLQTSTRTAQICLTWIQRPELVDCQIWKSSAILRIFTSVVPQKRSLNSTVAVSSHVCLYMILLYGYDT